MAWLELTSDVMFYADGSAPNTSPTPRKALLCSASCDPTPLATPFSRPWRSDVRAGQTERKPDRKAETGLDPNGASGVGSRGRCRL